MIVSILFRCSSISLTEHPIFFTVPLCRSRVPAIISNTLVSESGCFASSSFCSFFFHGWPRLVRSLAGYPGHWRNLIRLLSLCCLTSNDVKLGVSLKSRLWRHLPSNHSRTKSQYQLHPMLQLQLMRPPVRSQLRLIGQPLIRSQLQPNCRL